MQQGIPIEKAKEIVDLVKDSKKKRRLPFRRTWSASAAKTATRYRKSSPCCRGHDSESICGLRITGPTGVNAEVLRIPAHRIINAKEVFDLLHDDLAALETSSGKIPYRRASYNRDW